MAGCGKRWSKNLCWVAGREERSLFAVGGALAASTRFSGIGDKIEQGGGEQRVIPAEGFGGESQGIRVGDGVHASAGLPAAICSALAWQTCIIKRRNRDGRSGGSA